MRLPVLELPPPVPIIPDRPPQENIPATRAERERLKALIEQYVAVTRPVPPLSVAEIRTHTEALLQRHGLSPQHVDYAGVLLSNESWREQLASVPYHRRLLLLPKCLRVEDRCPAPFDEFGLLCKRCGLCSIQELQEEAERLGYAVLVAEGSSIVMAIIQTGKIDAIVGVSCLNVLERAFPYMEAAAIPGIAIPLLQDDCRDTNVDLEWVWDVIHLTSEDRTRRLDLTALRDRVSGWFEPASLETIVGPVEGRTEVIARDWLAGEGKRWRPFLTACVFQALQADPQAPLPDDLRRAAVAVECFHKASLIHDDIEDQDALRYGEQTLHEQWGVPVALNVGDLLLGEGYRLLAECDVPAEVRSAMLRVAARGHRTLCLGQGAELDWTRDPRPLRGVEVLEIFRQKTAPAFEVALRLGAVYAGADSEETADLLTRYSEALGIAYQIRDDLEDLAGTDAPNDLVGMRPSLPMALAWEKSKGANRELLERFWRREPGPGETAADVRRVMAELAVEERARALLEAYKEQAIRSLVELENSSLKGLLRRVIGKIFSVEVKGWCSEFEAANASPALAPDSAPESALA
jgi:geranylgeranyl diphosphate synthase, type II